MWNQGDGSTPRVSREELPPVMSRRSLFTGSWRSGIRSITPRAPSPSLPRHDWCLNALDDQMRWWCEAFPGLRSRAASVGFTADIAGGSEGILAIPCPLKLDPVGEVEDLDFERAYHYAVETVLQRLASLRDDFDDRLCGILGRGVPSEVRLTGPRYMRMERGTRDLYQRGMARHGDFLLVNVATGSADVGHDRVGVPVGRAGMDVYAATCLILTHPERLCMADQVWMDLPGSRASVGFPSHGPPMALFSWCDGILSISWEWTASASDHAGICTMWPI